MASKDLYLPGAASIVDQLDTRLLIVLRDGRNILGTLRSFDQYLNLVLENTVEREYHEGKDQYNLPCKLI
jgi:small nuclear ribonucleoprotein (snRNP)-like protein